MDRLWSETCWNTFKYFINLIVSTYYILSISWIITCLIIIDARCKIWRPKKSVLLSQRFTQDDVCVVTAVGASYTTKHKLFVFQDPDAPNKILWPPQTPRRRVASGPWRRVGQLAHEVLQHRTGRAGRSQRLSERKFGPCQAEPGSGSARERRDFLGFFRLKGGLKTASGHEY